MKVLIILFAGEFCRLLKLKKKLKVFAASFITWSLAQCPKCTNNPDYVCGFSESTDSHKWFTNYCHLIGWNCYNDNSESINNRCVQRYLRLNNLEFSQVDKKLCKKNLGVPNDCNTF